MLTWLKNLFAPSKKEPLVLTKEVAVKKKPAAKKTAAKAPAKKGRPRKSK
jgi:hypothetical protein